MLHGRAAVHNEARLACIVLFQVRALDFQLLELVDFFSGNSRFRLLTRFRVLPPSGELFVYCDCQQSSFPSGKRRAS